MSNPNTPSGVRVRDRRNPGWLWLDNEVIDLYAAKMKPLALACYVYLCRRANEQGRAWPSQRTMAEGLGVDRGTVRSALKQLVALKLIHLEIRRNADGSHNSTVYTLLEVPKGAQGGGLSAQGGSIAQGGPNGPEEDTEKNTSKESNDSLSGGGKKRPAAPAQEPKNPKPMSTKQYGIARLVEARNRARAEDKNPLPLDEPFKRRFGDVYAAHLADGWEAEELEAPLDLMVRCACGEGPEGLTYGRGRARWVPLVDAIAHLRETGAPVSLEDKGAERERQRAIEEREAEREAELRALMEGV